MDIPVVENVLKLNDQIAAMNREILRGRGIFTLDLMGAPGCGKTALLEKTLERLAGQLRVGVIVGDLTTARDAQRMARFCKHVVQVNTGKGCHLEANHVRQALGQLDLSALDLLIIENVGNLICPVGFDLGQDLKVAMFSISGGDDKAAKHPYIVIESELILLSKIDLLPHIPFDMELFYDDIRQLKPAAKVIETSVTTGQGMDQWIEWLGQQVQNGRPSA